MQPREEKDQSCLRGQSADNQEEMSISLPALADVGERKSSPATDPSPVEPAGVKSKSANLRPRVGRKTVLSSVPPQLPREESLHLNPTDIVLLSLSVNNSPYIISRLNFSLQIKVDIIVKAIIYHLIRRLGGMKSLSSMFRKFLALRIFLYHQIKIFNYNQLF